MDRKNLWPVGVFGVALITAWFLSGGAIAFLESEFYPGAAAIAAFSPMELVYTRLELAALSAVAALLVYLAIRERAFDLLLPVLAAMVLGSVLGWTLVVPVALELLVPGGVEQVYSVQRAVSFAISLTLVSAFLVALPVGIYRLKETGRLPSRRWVEGRRKPAYAFYGLFCLFVSADPFVAAGLFGLPVAVVEAVLRAAPHGGDTGGGVAGAGGSSGSSSGSAHYDANPLLIFAMGAVATGLGVVGFFCLYSAQVDAWLEALVPESGGVVYAVKAPTDFVYARALLAGVTLLVVFTPLLARVARVFRPDNTWLRRFATPVGLSFPAGCAFGALLTTVVAGKLAAYSLEVVDIMILSPLDMARYLVAVSLTSGLALASATCIALHRWSIRV